MTQPAILPENVADPLRNIWLAFNKSVMQVLSWEEEDCGT